MISVFAALVLALCTPSPAGADQNAAQTLSKNKAIARPLGAADTHEYRLKLRRGEFVHIVIEPLRVQVAVRLLGPDQKLLAESRGFGGDDPEWMNAIAPASGTYTIHVRSVGESPEGTGRYSIQLLERRAATAADRNRVAAQESFLKGIAAAEQKTKTGLETAVSNYRDALAGFSGSNHSLEAASVHLGIGLSLEALQKYEQAGVEYEEALGLYRSAKAVAAELSTLSRVGYVLFSTDKFEAAIGRYEEALVIARAIGARAEEANALIFMAFSCERLRQSDRAVQSATQAASIRHDLNDKSGEALALEVVAGAHQNLKQIEPAVRRYQEAIAIRQAIGDHAGEANDVRDIGFTYLVVDQFRPASEWFEKSLTLNRALGDVDAQATVLQELAYVYRKLKQTEDAVRSSEALLAIRRAAKDRKAEASAIDDIAFAYDQADRYEQSVSFYAQALAIQQELHDKEGAAHSLFFMALGSRHLQHYDKAIEYGEASLTLRRELHDRPGEALAVEDMAMTLEAMGDGQRAAAQYEQALVIRRELKDRAGEASDLVGLAGIHRLTNPVQATSLFEEALAIQRELGDLTGQGRTLNALGTVEAATGHFDRELGYYQQALTIARQTGVRTNEGLALTTLGSAYARLGLQDQARGYFDQALAIGRETGNVTIQAGSLWVLGLIKGMHGQLQDAVRDLEEGLALSRQANTTFGQAQTLAFLGVLYGRLGQPDRAANALDQATALAQRSSNPLDQANTLMFKGLNLTTLNRLDEAAAALRQALAIVETLKLRELEGDVLSGLMAVLARAKQPRLAIAYGKRSINVVQEIRDENATLDQTLRRSFIEGSSSRYRLLADLLAGQGRLAEAQQVLDLLKGDEFSEFVMRDRSTATDKVRLTLTPEEAAWEARYETIADRLTTLGTERRALLGKADRTPAEDTALASLEADIEAGNHAFQMFLSELDTSLGGRKSSNQINRVRDAEGLMETLRDLGPGAVAVYTIAGEQGYRSILITSDVEKGYAQPISAADLNRKILAFREALRNPAIDPRPIARELYDILVKPMEKDLAGAGARTIMWSLDGALRYVPVAALYDGEHYLVERFQNVVFTPASESRLKDPVSHDWRGIGFGVALAHDQFQALPNVPNELRSIINAGPADHQGVLPGSVRLDAEFTKEGFRSELRKQYSVVHIASHFDFSPGRDRDSFLLLGDGTKMTLEEFRNMPQVLQGVELLTLSACDTAVGGEDADGREVEGFAVLAQRQGAKAVVATLWAVADESTALLMREFYRLRTADSSITKAEALRQAQLSLLSGKVQGSDSSNRGVRLTTGNSASPTFATDSRRPFAHPYYWAPFLLMGNWK